jgi:hypothetical protein
MRTNWGHLSVYICFDYRKLEFIYVSGFDYYSPRVVGLTAGIRVKTVTLLGVYQVTNFYNGQLTEINENMSIGFLSNFTIQDFVFLDPEQTEENMSIGLLSNFTDQNFVFLDSEHIDKFSGVGIFRFRRGKSLYLIRFDFCTGFVTQGPFVRNNKQFMIPQNFGDVDIYAH